MQATRQAPSRRLNKRVNLQALRALRVMNYSTVQHLPDHSHCLRVVNISDAGRPLFYCLCRHLRTIWLRARGLLGINSCANTSAATNTETPNTDNHVSGGPEGTMPMDTYTCARSQRADDEALCGNDEYDETAVYARMARRAGGGA